MKKVNPAKDYAISAFRYWARMDCVSYEDAVLRIAEDGRDPDGESAKLADILACAETFRRLEQRKRQVICDAVRVVYMAVPEKQPSRKELTERVTAYAAERYVVDRQVWRYLAEACVEFAECRGLRVDDDEL